MTNERKNDDKSDVTEKVESASAENETVTAEEVRTKRSGNILTRISGWIYCQVDEKIVIFSSLGGASVGTIISAVISLVGLLLLLVMACLGILIASNAIGAVILLAIIAVAGAVLCIIGGFYFVPMAATHYVLVDILDKEQNWVIYLIVATLWTSIFLFGPVKNRIIMRGRKKI